MIVAKLPKLAPIEIGWRTEPHLPVIPLSMEVSQAGCAAPHAHPRGQLIYASQGVMRVVSGKEVLVVPPSQAVWVPPDVEHEVYFPGEVSLRNLFLERGVSGRLPRECTILKVSPLLRELILKAVIIGESYTPESAGYRLMTVLIDELCQAEPTELRLPMGHDERLQRAIEKMVADPGAIETIEVLASVACTSPRTLARLFIRETGLTFGAWKKRLILQEAIRRLAAGQNVTTVAFDLGYQSLSAFIEMFRQTLGASPGQYLKDSPTNVKCQPW